MKTDVTKNVGFLTHYKKNWNIFSLKIGIFPSKIFISFASMNAP